MRTILGVLRLAWRNLRRNQKRTILTTSGLAVALIIMVIMEGMFTGMTRDTLDNMINQENAHLRLFAHGFLAEDMPGLDFLVQDSDSLAAAIRKETGNPATPRMQMPATLISGGEEVILMVRGLDLKNDPTVFKTLNNVVEGQTLDGTEGEALIGTKLAKDLSLKLGDRFTVLLKSAPGAMNTLRLTVKGIIYTSHPDFDARSVIISLHDARTLALAPGAATEIAMRASREDRAGALQKQLSAEYPGYDWETWLQGAEDFLPLMRVKRIGSGIMVMILALVAVVAIMNTMTMAVHERTREIGALRAMGFTRPRILWMFLAEGLLIGFIAAVVGAVIGGGLTLWMGDVGLHFSQYDDVDFGMAMSMTVYPKLSVANISFAVIFGVLVGAISSWRAAWHASHGEVVRALREGML